MNSSFVVIIPARYASTRLPGKPLLKIAGIPLLQHVYNVASKSEAESVYIATDDERILRLAESFGADTLMTATTHRTGTDRLAEAVNQLNLDRDTIIVNLQGDEVGMSEKVINQVAQILLNNPASNMATICENLTDSKQILDPNVVKVVRDKHGRALYFSRSAIPWYRSLSTDIDDDNVPVSCFKHIGLYAYRVGFLQYFTELPVCELEQQESLEQLRALFHGEEIYVEIACETTGVGVDTPDDLERARQLFD